jgi:4-hydroxybutyryl-CoA dehydratase/vinylacetyl-CoA-Delta-isomerase
MMQRENFVLGGAMTDGKGDRSKAPSQQADPDLFLRVVKQLPDGVVIRGAKVHQTGCLNSHWLMIMPGGRLTENEREYAIMCALPVDTPGLTYIVGRQSCDTRVMEDADTDIDLGNAKFGGQVSGLFLCGALSWKNLRSFCKTRFTFGPVVISFII